MIIIINNKKITIKFLEIHWNEYILLLRLFIYH